MYVILYIYDLDKNYDAHECNVKARFTAFKKIKSFIIFFFLI